MMPRQIITGESLQISLATMPRERTLLSVRLSNLTHLPGFSDNGEIRSGWKA
jgi:hypothetical protein